jgi:predicted Zn-dependent peptidase
VLFDAPDEIHKITARDLQAVAERYLQTSGRTVIIAEPDESQDDSDEDEDDGQDGPLSGVLH